MSEKKRILVTGGTGFVGSHVIIELLKAGYQVLALDNGYNSNSESLKGVEKITGEPIPSVTLDICDKEALDELFRQNEFYAVLHLAAYKAVGESVGRPLDYYRCNIGGTVNLLECMKKYNVKNLFFSSSSTIYGKPQYLPIDENHPSIGNQITNPYGRSKYMVEHILKDLFRSDSKSWNILILRYFNPVGAHESGLIGEQGKGTPKNLMPYISLVAAGKLSAVQVFGDDYNTPDGTAIRDYMHISDLAFGHTLAFKKLQESPGLKIYNLGAGKSYSVLEVIRAFEKASGKTIPYKIAGRRAGDNEEVRSNSSLAERELGWKATKTLDEMCRDFWNWQQKNIGNETVSI